MATQKRFLAKNGVDNNSQTLVNVADPVNAQDAVTKNFGATTYATAAQGTLATNALPASSYTAADVLSMLKTVDGSGSGVDADLLDGHEATYFASVSYVDGLIDAANALVYKGTLDCSVNPNYPAANAGYTYLVDTAGKIGGASGLDVEVGDMLICKTDTTASGTQAAVGAQWGIIEKNNTGAVSGPASSTANSIAVFSGTTGKILADTGILISSLATTAALANKLDSSAYTAADVMSKIQTVDGSGTGLDADLLDGQHASAFATAAQGTKADNALPASSYTAADVLSKLAESGSLPLTNGSATSSTLTTSTTAANQIVDSFNIGTFRSAKYQVQVSSGTVYQTSELLAVHDGTSVYLTEYGSVSSGINLATFDASISSSNMNLTVTPVNAVTTIKLIRTAINI